jgi:hypothetical protein
VLEANTTVFFLQTAARTKKTTVCEKKALVAALKTMVSFSSSAVFAAHPGAFFSATPAFFPATTGFFQQARTLARPTPVIEAHEQVSLEPTPERWPLGQRSECPMSK